MTRAANTVRLIAVILIAIVLQMAVMPAQAEELGRTSIGATPSAGLRADFKRGSKFTLTEPGTITGFFVYLDGQGGAQGTQEVRVALYRNQNGVPTSLVTQSQNTVSIDHSSVPQWHGFSTPMIQLEPGDYWIMLHSGVGTGVARFYFDGPANWYGNADAFADGSSNPFGAGNTGNGTLSIYAAYEPESKLHHAGPMTVGSLPSQGMSANFKRATSFQLTETGRLKYLSAYLDGLGGANGTQHVYMALYDDQNGAPFRLLATSFPQVVNAGDGGRWYKYAVDPSTFVHLLPGRYWFTLHSASPAGVARYFMQDPGTWCGNADHVNDGPTERFGGNCAPGNKMSGFISFEPTPVALVKAGRADVASRPSAGLRANYMRGSRFAIFERDAVITDLYAYLDGLGGASGSQKIRMALYNAIDNIPEIRKVSDEVTIAAGTPPGWVRFPITPVPIGPGEPVYNLMIMSGDTGGVVRNYGDGPANWLGVELDDYPQAWPFIMEGGEIMPNPTAGSVTLSVYAEVRKNPETEW